MNRPGGIHLLTLGQFAISGLGLLGYLSLGGGLVVLGMLGAAQGGLPANQRFTFIYLAWTIGALSLLIIPSLVISFLRLIDRPLPTWQLPHSLYIASLLMLMWPVVLLVGSLAEKVSWSWAVMPPLQIVAVVVPLWWFWELGRRALPRLSTQRSWAMVSYGLVISPPFIIAVELVVLLVAVSVFVLWLSGNPDLMRQLMAIAQRMAAGQADPESLGRLLTPLIQQPVAIYSLLALVAGVIPVLEEFLKPVAVWFLLGRNITPAEGFQAGMLCGLTFGLVETLGNLSTPLGSAWTVLVIGRMTTGLLHMVSTGLIGWGLASAWSQAKYARLAACFIISASLHGLWNGLSVIMGVTPEILPSNLTGFLSFANRLGPVVPVALVVLAVAMFSLLLMLNHHLVSTQPAAPEAVPALES